MAVRIVLFLASAHALVAPVVDKQCDAELSGEAVVMLQQQVSLQVTETPIPCPTLPPAAPPPPPALCPPVTETPIPCPTLPPLAPPPPSALCPTPAPASQPPAAAPKASEMFHSLDKLRLAPWAPSERPACASADEAMHGHWEGDQWVPWHCLLSSRISSDHKTKFNGKKILIFGDSQGTQLANHLSEGLGCSADKSMGMPQCPQQNVNALKNFFGSNAVGIEYGCVECMGCTNTKYSCPGGIEIWSVVAEFIDQKSITSSQHPTLLKWLFNSFASQYEFDYIVGNIGLHEITKIQDDATSLEPFVQRTASMAALLSGSIAQGRKCLFILTGDVSPNFNVQWANVTSSYHVHLMNGIMRASLADAGVPVADPFGLSRYDGDKHLLHTDRVHMHGKGDLYYKTLARIILTTL